MFKGVEAHFQFCSTYFLTNERTSIISGKKKCPDPKKIRLFLETIFSHFVVYPVSLLLLLNQKTEKRKKKKEKRKTQKTLFCKTFSFSLTWAFHLNEQERLEFMQFFSFYSKVLSVLCPLTSCSIKSSLRIFSLKFEIEYWLFK